MMPAIPIHHTSCDQESAWDAGANVKRLGDEPGKAKLRALHAWVDPDEDPETKSAYKLPHHNVSEGGDVGAANMKACAAAMGRLNGGGLDIPEADRKAVYAHLAAHYKDADMEPPELKFGLGTFEKKELRFDVKQVGDDGTFEGILAAYGNVDLGGDLIEPGAFNKTISDNNGEVPMLWQHKVDEPIGMLYLRDTPDGLAVRGALDLNVQRAREAHSLLKKRIVKGLSIGFDAVKDAIENGIRRLKEIRLWEGSVVTFPMNLRALISSVKARRQDGPSEVKDFAAELQNIQLWAARSQMMDALWCSLYDVINDQALTTEQKVGASQASIEQFQAAYLEMLPDYLALTASMSMMWMRAPEFEKKAGRVLSGVNYEALKKVQQDMQACMDAVQALLDAADGAEGAGKATPAGRTQTKAAANGTEPVVDHSAIISKFDELKGLMQWKHSNQN